MENHLEFAFTLIFNIITAIATIIAITLSLFFYKREKKEFYRRKNIEAFISLESNRDTFLGSLQALGIEDPLLNNEKFTLEQLMYYNGLLNTLWVRNNYSDKRFKKIERILKREGFIKAIDIATRYNKKKPLIHPEGQTERIIATDDFRRAWNYLEKYWSNESVVRVIINVTLESFQSKA